MPANTTSGQNRDLFEVEETFFSSLFISALLLSSLLLNGLVALMFFKKSELRHTPSNKLVVNVIATNCIVSIFVLPALLLSAVSQRWVLGDVGCQLHGIISTATFSSWPLTLASLSIDRFHFIVNPLSYPINMTLFKTNVILCLIWIYSIITGIVPLFIIPAFLYNTVEHTCTVDWSTSTWFSVYLLTVSYLIPLLIQLWCYGHIVLAAKRQARFGRRLSRVSVAPLEISRIIRETSATRAIKKTVLVLGSFFVVFTPYTVYIILRAAGSKPSFVGFWLNLCLLTATVVYPILFVLRAKGLKKEFGDLVKSLKLSKNRIQDLDTHKEPNSQEYDRRRSTRLMAFSSYDPDVYESETSLTQPYARRRSELSERRVSWNLQPSYSDNPFCHKGGNKLVVDSHDNSEMATTDCILTSSSVLPGQVSPN